MKDKYANALYKFSRNRFLSDTKYPSVQELKTFLLRKFPGATFTNYDVRKARNRLPLLTKFRQLGDKGAHRNHGFKPLITTTLGWVEVDLMFLHEHKKKGGQAFIAVDILSKRVYARPIPNKSLKTLKSVISEMIKSPGFTQVRRILSDEESALKSLERKNTDFPGIRFVTTSRKAKTVERMIRSLKLNLRRIMIANKDNNIKRWAKYLPRAVDALNTKVLPGGKLPGLNQVRPIDITPRNVGAYVSHQILNNPAFSYGLHPVIPPHNKNRSDKIFKFDIGSKVYFAKQYHPDRNIRDLVWGETKSFSGHFNQKSRKTGTDDEYVVSHRWLQVSSKGYMIPLYNVRGKQGQVIHSVYEHYIRPFPPPI